MYSGLLNFSVTVLIDRKPARGLVFEGGHELALVGPSTEEDGPRGRTSQYNLITPTITPVIRIILAQQSVIVCELLAEQLKFGVVKFSAAKALSKLPAAYILV